MENKEFYMEPEVETILFPRQDIVTASVGSIDDIPETSSDSHLDQGTDQQF